MSWRKEAIETRDYLELLLEPSVGGGFAVSLSGYSLPLFENQNKLGFGGDRPEDVAVPEPQYFKLLYTYDGDALGVGVTLSYSINECYPDTIINLDDPFPVDAACSVLGFLGVLLLSSLLSFILLKEP